MQVAEPPCSRCNAACCRRGTGPHEFAVTLIDTDCERFRDVAVKVGDLWVIPYDGHGDCVFLKDNRCSVHPGRPLMCRQFNCVAGWNFLGEGRHSGFLRDNPHVRELVQLVVQDQRAGPKETN